MIPNLKEVSEGIYRGGQPANDADWQSLKDLGITDVIKLNISDSHQPDEGAIRLGLKVFYCPISTVEQILTEPDLQTLGDVVGFIKPGTFVHCEHGQDRTGLAIALFRVLVQGWQPAFARAEMMKNGFHEIELGLDKAFFDLTSKQKDI